MPDARWRCHPGASTTLSESSLFAFFSSPQWHTLLLTLFCDVVPVSPMSSPAPPVLVQHSCPMWWERRTTDGRVPTSQWSNGGGLRARCAFTLWLGSCWDEREGLLVGTAST